MKKFFKNSLLSRILILLILLFIFIFISALSYVRAVSNNISNSVFRLHVIANSDSAEDQNLKYKVRDSLLKYMNQISKDCSSKSEVIELVQQHKNIFYSIAQEVVLENGYQYSINIDIDTFDFPTKHYGDISLPSGSYDALRVEIGEAKGENWWCVMFPPLCFVDISSGIVPDESKSIIQDNLSDEEYSLVSDNHQPSIKFKFSLIEFFQNFNIAN